MSKQLLSIDDFSSWIINDTTAQGSKGFSDMSWFDIWKEDGVAQINKALEADTTTSMTTDALSFTTFGWEIIAWNEDEEIWYNSTWTTWTLLHTNTNAWDNNDIITYQDYLIYASVDELWISDDTTISWGFVDNPTWWSWTNAFVNWVSAGKHYFKIFNNRLYISDWNIIAELDWASDPTDRTNWVFTDQAFTLPENENITCMEVVWWQLAIWTAAWNYYEWDWTSSNSTTIIKSSLWGISAMIQVENTLFVFAWINWTIYRYNWADFKPVFRIPDMRISAWSSVNKSAVRRYRNWFIFWIKNNWIYVINRTDENKPFSMAKYGAISWWRVFDEFDPTIRAIYIIDEGSSEDDFIISYNYDWAWIDRVSNNYYTMEDAWAWDTSAAPYIETIEYQLRNNNGKPNRIQGIQAMFRETIITWTDRNNIQVEYKTDLDTSYTVLGIIWLNGIDMNKILRGISKRAYKIKFRIKAWWENWDNDENTKLIQLKVF